jgi:uncharacterized membrane protein
MPYLRIHNTYSQLVAVAVMQDDPDACGEDGKYATHGWWNINPGDSTTVIYTDYDIAYVYAEAGDGTHWPREDQDGVVQFYVDPINKFDGCYLTGKSTWK